MKHSRKTRTLLAMGMGMILLFIPPISATAATLDSVRAEVISNDLRKAMAENSSSEYSVMVSLKGDAYDAYEKELVESNNARSSLESSTVEEIQSQLGAQRAQSSAFYQAQNQAAIKGKVNPDDIEYISKFSPVVFATVNATKINQLALNSQVASISYMGDNEIVDDTSKSEDEFIAPLSTLVDHNDYLEHYSSEIHASTLMRYATGDGIKIGFVEPANPEGKYYSQLKLVDDWSYRGDRIPEAHASKVALICNQIAPDAQFYSAAIGEHNGNYSVYSVYYVQAIEWLIECGVNIINMSWGLGHNINSYTQQYLNTYLLDSIWMDHVSIYHNVTLVVAAGNYGASGVCSTSMAYNSITVGKVTPTGERWDPIETDANDPDISSSYNSMLVTTATKPDICAPGADYTYGDIETGTSYSAPQVAGVVALMMEMKPILMLRPEGVKAMLCANTNPDYAMHTTERTATNPYAEFGAGVIDCNSLYSSLRTTKYIINTPASVPANTTLSYTVQLSKMMDTRIALVYSKHIEPGELGCSTDYDDMIAYDLTHIELEVWVDGERIAYSDNYANNVKILSVYSDETVNATVKIVFKEATTHTTELALAWKAYVPN